MFQSSTSQSSTSQSSKVISPTVAVKVCHTLCLAGLLAAAAPGYAEDFGKSKDRCTGAAAVDLNSTLRGHGAEGSRLIFFKVEIPSPGIVTLDAGAPGSAAAPSLGLFGSDCGLPAATAGVAIVQRFLNHMLLAVRDPGTYFFALATQDPRQPLQEYEVRAGFMTLDLSGIAGWDKDDDVIEIDPDQIGAPPPYSSSRSDLPCLMFHRPPGEVDDHSDRFPCATPLSPGEEAAGEIGGGWQGDRDVFAFVLGGAGGGDLWRVRLGTTGETDTFGGLYDRHGQRLARADDGGAGANFRIVKTLSPGLYFVRVEGRHRAEGPYSLEVETSAW